MTTTRRTKGGGGSAAAVLAGAFAVVGLIISLLQVNGVDLLGLAEHGAERVRAATGDQVAQARTDLPQLAVAARGPRTGYDRGPDQWGPAWADVDDNGCRTRDDILRRDLTAVTPARGCSVNSGVLQDPYTGWTIQYRRADPATVQIDHVVALSEAWRTGARSWTTAQRTQFANDPGELLAVDGPTNAGKSDSGADGWSPPGPQQCDFAVRYVLVKAKYGLTVTTVERQSLNAMLDTCD